jgi:LysR family hydrogen peroxide-inducible transcriptional activator
MFVTQPTLRKFKIEEELSILIFDRSKKTNSAIDIGKIVNQAKNIVNEADRIQDIVEQQKDL